MEKELKSTVPAENLQTMLAEKHMLFGSYVSTIEEQLEENEQFDLYP